MQYDIVGPYSDLPWRSVHFIFYSKSSFILLKKFFGGILLNWIFEAFGKSDNVYQLEFEFATDRKSLIIQEREIENIKIFVFHYEKKFFY